MTPKGKGGNPENLAGKKPGVVRGGRKGGKTAMARKVAIFIREYLATDSASAAARAAGYSEASCRSAGLTMLKRPEVRAALDEYREKKSAEFDLRADAVLRELSAIVHLDPRTIIAGDGSLLPVPSWPDDVARAVSGFEIVTKRRGDEPLEVLKVKFSDKNRAIESAMRHLGLFERDNKQRPASDAIAESFRAIAERLPV